MGFSEGVKGFRLWNSESKKIILSRDVTFDESAMLKYTLRDTENENPNSLQRVEFEVPKKLEKASPTVDGPDDQEVEVEDSAPLFEIRQQLESIATSRPKRDIRKPTRYIDMVAYALPVTDGDVPDLGIIQENIEIFYDNQSAICLVKNQVHHAHTKDIDVRYHFVREIVDEGNILLQKIGIANNPADMLTKVVIGIKFQHYLYLINISRARSA
ncbi:hypothetical protein LWI28_009470 [Acer negundo]|uniref:Retroviral polymerase SH3-like domain-containing protein n=1 Tax=Acer negundo TaxID=4023 RepID=A0AAD5JT53_ACENE|nr:hypothetical protein LWI28_009470 [Acer negundo]